MNKKFMRVISVLLSLVILLNINVHAQDNSKLVKVMDENGNPVTGAMVIIGEGGKPLYTNANGEFSIRGDSLAPVLVKAMGFESQLINEREIIALETITLLKAPFQMGEKDMVSLPFRVLSRRRIPGAVSVLSPDEILKFDQTDLRGAIVGRVPGMFSSSNIRGFDEPLFVVDGIPRPAADINLQEIEQITVVKDLSAAMLYGSQASNGVILINTKRGEPLHKILKITAENGFNKPISFPKYLGAADYMELYNEALTNDGLATKFNDGLIENTRSGIDPIRYPDVEYYNSTFLKKWTSYQKVVGEVGGGNEIAQYYLNLGWNRSNGLLKVGEGANEKTDRLNMRANIDYKLQDAIRLRFDGAVVFNLSNGPRYQSDDFWNLSTTMHPEYYPLLIPVDLITDPGLLGALKPIDNKYVLGGTSEYQTNIYGELMKNGPEKYNDRLVQISTGLDFDLKSITPGLKASVFFSFDVFNMFTTNLLNSYAVYNPTYSADSVDFTKYGVDTKVDAQSVTDASQYRRIGIYGTLDYNRIFGDHEIKATALTYRDQFSIQDVLQPTKHLHAGLNANYMFKRKYIAELTGVIAGSSKLYETSPYAFSPGVGLAWILSEENFLKKNKVISYLKIKSNWAINHSDESISDFYLGRDFYEEGNLYVYNHSLASNRSRILSNGNSSLGWEKKMNLNVGFESGLLENQLWVEGAYFYNKTYDMLSRNANILPDYFTSLPYFNYQSNQNQGMEIGLKYTKQIEKFQFIIGANMVYVSSKVLKADELNYPNDYRSSIGKPTDAIFGFVALGFFNDPTEIANAPFQSFGSVQPGDIRYKDLNGDNIINNEDRMMIGNSDPTIGYSLHLNLKYKAFELFLMGTGENGEDRIFNNPYYWVYGDRKYSTMVLNRWTPSTAETADYPRLTSTTGSNNFQNSTFWLYKDNSFTLRTVQLTFSLENVGFAGLNQLSVFARGYNLATFSAIKDRTDLNIGSSPKTRSFSLGLTLQF